MLEQTESPVDLHLPFAILQDDSPLYLFDSSLRDDKRKRSLLNDYTVPKYFDDGMFCYSAKMHTHSYKTTTQTDVHTRTCRGDKCA